MLAGCRHAIKIFEVLAILGEVHITPTGIASNGLRVRGRRGGNYSQKQRQSKCRLYCAPETN
jgi:hypothetical protein